MRIFRVLRGGVLPCGCLVGVYETFSGSAVGIIDQRGSDCPEISHRVGVPVDTSLLVNDGEPAVAETGAVAAHDVAHAG